MTRKEQERQDIEPFVQGVIELGTHAVRSIVTLAAFGLFSLTAIVCLVLFVLDVVGVWKLSGWEASVVHNVLITATGGGALVGGIGWLFPRGRGQSDVSRRAGGPMSANTPRRRP